ncbi:MAG: hypothetical protein VX000_18330, partial [Myxococcota bacterium]|nr:hypothetical protein [Myxococcota bacterium]
MTVSFRTALLLAVSTAFALPAHAQSGQETATIVVDVFRHGSAKTPIAVPEPVGNDAAEAEFYSTLKRDLEICGWFTVIDPDAYIEP